MKPIKLEQKENFDDLQSNGNNDIDVKQESLTMAAKIAYYEKNKQQNFIASSKLEGLDVTSHNLSVDELVKKYTQSSVLSNG